MPPTNSEQAILNNQILNCLTRQIHAGVRSEKKKNRIELELSAAIRGGKRFRSDNTEYDPVTRQVTLYGSVIVYGVDCASPYRTLFSWAGYSTATTRSRLNAVADALGLTLGFAIAERKPCVRQFKGGKLAQSGMSANCIYSASKLDSMLFQTEGVI